MRGRDACGRLHVVQLNCAHDKLHLAGLGGVSPNLPGRATMDTMAIDAVQCTLTKVRYIVIWVDLREQRAGAEERRRTQSCCNPSQERLTRDAR